MTSPDQVQNKKSESSKSCAKEIISENKSVEDRLRESGESRHDNLMGVTRRFADSEDEMLSPAAFLRRMPPSLIQRYLAASDIALPDFAGDLSSTTPFLRVIQKLASEQRDRVLSDFDRANAMADEVGQNALYGVVRDRAQLDKLPDGKSRALWLYSNEPENFRRAEESRYTDDHRHGRNWSGFLGPAGIKLTEDREPLEAFEKAVQQHFNSRNVHIDLFARRRKRQDKEDIELIQATVYFEGRPEQILEFVDEQLDLRDRRPVIEAAITYEPASGSIEIVAGDRHEREEFVRLFVRTLLATDFDAKTLPIRYFDLQRLLRHFDFPTDASDGIESVRVTCLRLWPLDTASQRLTIECMHEEAGPIWEISAARFGANDPLAGGWLINQAKFTITFRGGSHLGKPRKLPVTITMPHGCNLKDRTDYERIIGEKYLRRWRLLRDL